MKAMLAAAIFALLAGFLPPATAAEYTVKHVETMLSEPGADKITFLADVGHKLRAFSDHTRFEACAAIATDGSRYGVVITTSGSHIGCAINTDDVPAGMHYTGETIHSHPRPTKFYASKADMQFIAGGNERVTATRMSTDEFSDGDYAAPGYLAGRRGLYHQSGAGTSMKVSSR